MRERYNIGIDAHAIGLRQGGNETYVYGLLNGLSQIEHPDFKYIVFLSEGIPVPEFLLKNKCFSFATVSPSAALRFIVDIPRKTYTEGLNLLHTQYHLPIISRCPGIITLHDVSFLRYPEFFPKKLYWQLKLSLLYSIRKSKKIITVSEFSKREIIKFYDVEQDKVDVIYNGVSENFRPVGQEDKEKILKKYGIKNPYILSVSNLQPRKNLSRLIKAFSSLVKNNEKFSYDLVIVGRKLWLCSEIFNEIREANIQERVILTGYVPEEDLVYLYNFAEVFVYPSLYEGFGLPIVEAMACGCPVITSSVSSLPEVAGKAGIMVNPYDVEEILQAINGIIDNPDLKRNLKIEGLKQSQKFSWKSAAEKTLKVYESVLC